MHLDWRTRLTNIHFWLALVPAILLLAQTVLAIFHIDWRPEELNNQLLAVINAVFGILTLLGIVNDPTSTGLHDTIEQPTDTPMGQQAQFEAQKQTMKDGDNDGQ